MARLTAASLKSCLTGECEVYRRSRETLIKKSAGQRSSTAFIWRSRDVGDVIMALASLVSRIRYSYISSHGRDILPTAQEFRPNH